MNQTIEIHYQISDTSKEIYQFQQTGDNTWKYVGIYFSNRNDVSDLWGDRWKKDIAFLCQKDQELKALAVKFGYDDFLEAIDNEPEGGSFDEEAALIQRKYNPCCQKTNKGELYYSGIHWGYGNRKGQYKPKLSSEEIEKEIVNKILKFRIVI